jgi:hypothetical protein
MGTLLIPPWQSYNAGASTQGETPPTPPLETLTIVAVDTGLTGANFLQLSTAPTLVLVGDRIAQGGAEGFVQGIIANLVFLDTVAGFSPGSAEAWEDAGGTPIDWATFDVGLLGTAVVRYRADLGVTITSGKVSGWANQGTIGASLSLSQGTAANRPTQVASDANFNNQSTLDFAPSGATWNLLACGNAPTVTAVDGFFVLKLRNDPPAASTEEGFIHVSNANTAKYPRASDGVVALNTFSSAQKVMVNPTISLATPHLTELISTGSEYTWRLNGVQQFTTATNTVTWASRIWVGVGDLAAATHYDGYMAEIITYDAKLSTNYRMIFETYVEDRYGIDVAGV